MHMLTCRRDAQEAIWSLASWWAVTQGQGSVTVHDDGSLTEDDIGRFERLFPGLQVIRRPDADKAMASLLADYPLCAAYRASHPLALKLLDCPLLEPSASLFLLDSDVLFFGPVDEAVTQAQRGCAQGSNLFMDDYQPSYSLSLPVMSTILNGSFTARINTGFAVIQCETIDLARIESILREWPEVAWNLAWAEQTLYALLSGAKVGLFDASCSVAQGKGLSGLVAKHYVGPVRGLFYVEGVHRAAGTVRRGARARAQ
jgi:hypothetical protein